MLNTNLCYFGETKNHDGFLNPDLTVNYVRKQSFLHKLEYSELPGDITVHGGPAPRGDYH